jgi:hypothetical protein
LQACESAVCSREGPRDAHQWAAGTQGQAAKWANGPCTAARHSLNLLDGVSCGGGVHHDRMDSGRVTRPLPCGPIEVVPVDTAWSAVSTFSN